MQQQWRFPPHSTNGSTTWTAREFNVSLFSRFNSNSINLPNNSTFQFFQTTLNSELARSRSVFRTLIFSMSQLCRQRKSCKGTSTAFWLQCSQTSEPRNRGARGSIRKSRRSISSFLLSSLKSRTSKPSTNRFH